MSNKTIEYSKEFNEEKKSKQIQFLKIPNLKKINKIESNAKDISFSLNSKNELKLILDNGPVHRKELVSGELIPEEKKEITGYSSKEYNENGFTGTLERYVASGSYTPSDTKYVSGQSSSNYNSGGYKGTLTRYLYSGSYTSSDSKEVTEKVNQTSEVYAECKSNGDISVRTSPPQKSTYSYNRGGYKGTLNGVSTHDDGAFRSAIAEASLLDKGDMKPNTTKSFGRHSFSTTYKGTVTRPSSDTRVYKYRGDVTRPEVDTRVYKYRGTVIKPEEDTRVFQEYYKYKVDIKYEEVESKNITLQDDNGNLLFPKATLDNISDIKIENDSIFFYHNNKWIELKNK